MIDWSDPESWDMLLGVITGMYIAAFIPVVVLAVLWYRANRPFSR